MERPLEYTHLLKFENYATDVNEKTNKKVSAPIIFEKYNEITFFEPTEAFHRVLVTAQRSYNEQTKTQI